MLFNWRAEIVSLVLLALLSACVEKKVAGLDEFGLPEVEFGKEEAETGTGAEELGKQAAVEESIDAKLAGKKYAFDGDSKDLIYTNVYSVPPSFFSIGSKGETATDPFADGGKFPVRDRYTVKDVLEAYGVVFGPGTSVFFGGGTSQIVVRQTEQEMKKVEAYIDQFMAQISRSDRTISVRVEIYELTATQAIKLQQEAESNTDHSVAWKSMRQLVNDGTARFVTSAMAASRSGQRAHFSDVQEVIYAVEFDWEDLKKQDKRAGLFDTRDVGTILEIDPAIGEDGESIELAFAFEYHSAPPTEKRVMTTISDAAQPVKVVTPVFHAKIITSKLTLASGAVRIIGAWRPTGKLEFEAQDLMQIAFLKVDL